MTTFVSLEQQAPTSFVTSARSLDAQVADATMKDASRAKLTTLGGVGLLMLGGAVWLWWSARRS